jgi:hypothetical protein
LTRKAADHQEQPQRKQQSSLPRRNNDHDDAVDDSDEEATLETANVGAASWFARSIFPGDDDTFAASTMTTMDDRHDDIDDEWKNNVIAEAMKEHDGSLERASLHVLAQWDCRLV